jgi:LAO/AO transport system kinase
MNSATPPSLDMSQLLNGVLTRDRAVLGRAITLIESEAPEKRAQAEQLLQALLDHPGKADRVGITGVPGVGKSTFIDALGTHLTARGHQVAVLAVDPTSPLTGGSILGDKTRMSRLSQDPNAFIRPSPSSGTLGGVAARTRETMLLCEAAGFDVVLVETVGVGQSEIVASEMVDFFLVLMLAGAGDELQGIKRGIFEIADMIAINKADGENRAEAERACAEYAGALQLLRPKSSAWTPPAVCVSALEGFGLEELWDSVMDHQRKLRENGELESVRAEQLARWMWQQVEDGLRRSIESDRSTQALARELEQEVRSGDRLAGSAAREVLDAFLGRR